jgi:hypothetical protein
MKKALKALSMAAVVCTIAAVSMVSGCGCCDDNSSCEPCAQPCEPCADPCGTGPKSDWGYSHGGTR